MSDEYKAICEKGLNEMYFLRERVTELEQRQQAVGEALRDLARLVQGLHRSALSLEASAESVAAQCFALADRLFEPPTEEPLP